MNPNLPVTKTVPKKQFLLASSVLMGLLLAITSTNFVYAKNNNLECSAPFVAENGKCVLTKNEVIDKTVHLSSDITYDGQGYKLIAAMPGIVDNSTTAQLEYQTSVPEVMMLAHQAHGFTLKNLTFVGGDFDLVILDAKNDPDQVQKSHISQCHFSANYVSVTIVKADDILFNHNTHDGIGVASLILRDSDRNQVKHYDVTARANNLGLVPIWPGNRQLIAAGAFPACGARWGRGFPFSNFTVAGIPRGSEVLNIIADNALYQFPLLDFNQNPEIVPEDTLFEGNNIAFTGNGGFTGYDLSDRTVRTTMRQSKIIGPSQFGIFLSGTQGNTVTTPGTCSGNSDRLCANDVDCNIPGFDTASLGTCEGEAATSLVSQTQDALIEGNIIQGSFVLDAIQISLTINPAILNNFISGGSRTGIFMNSRALETATITGNKITENGMGSFNAINRGGIGLFSTGGATNYGSDISLNDLTGNFRAIGANAAYSFNTNLMVGGKGNFYRDCLDSDGFRNSNEPDQNGKTDSPIPFITDTAPLSESPVFQDEDGFVHLKDPLPLTCTE